MIRRAEIVNANHLNTTPVTSNYTVKGNEDLILADATAAALTVTLPDATANKNLAIYIKKVDSSGNAVTVATSLSQTIDGASTVSLSSQYATTSLVSDGVNWQIKTVSGSSFTGGTISGATTVSVANANAFVVGANGTTNPVLKVDSATASVATGIAITGAAAAGGVKISALSSGSNESIQIVSKGTGSVTVAPGTDGTSAFLITKADLTTAVVRVDTTNSRMSVGSSAGAPSQALDVFGKMDARGEIQSQATQTATAGGGAICLSMGSSSAIGLYFGSGAPTITATQGSMYFRTDGSSTSTRLYINTTGSTTWTAVTTAA